VELLFPVRDERIQEHILAIMGLQKRDTAKAWLLNSSGVYERILPKEGEERFCSQETLLRGKNQESS
jgi:polyphosphate kinase